jgi:hypothetical protein
MAPPSQKIEKTSTNKVPLSSLDILRAMESNIVKTRGPHKSPKKIIFKKIINTIS